MSDIRPR